MKKILLMGTLLLACAIACQGQVALDGTPTEVPATVTPSVTPEPSFTPEPTQVVKDGSDLMAKGWFTAQSVKTGKEPKLEVLFEGNEVTWSGGTGQVGFVQGINLADGHGELACKFSVSMKDVAHSPIVTAQIIYRVYGTLPDDNTKQYLDSNFYQPLDRDFYIVIGSDIKSINFFLGVATDDERDMVDYQFRAMHFICYHNVSTGDNSLRR